MFRPVLATSRSEKTRWVKSLNVEVILAVTETIYQLDDISIGSEDP